MKNVILFFGSFNPVHKGHLALAESVLERKLAEEVWFVLSPHNPFKKQEDLWPETTRTEKLRKVLEGRKGLYLCTAELDLPKPSYTVQTLRYLREKHPRIRFSILMGEDNLAEIHRWKEYREILDSSDIYVYPRFSRQETLAENGIRNTGNGTSPENGEKEEKRTKTGKGGPNTYPVQKEFPGKIHWIDSPLLDISSTRIREMMQKGMDVSNLIP